MKSVFFFAILVSCLSLVYSSDFKIEGNVPLLSNLSTGITFSNIFDFKACKEASQIINDAQSFNTTGALSPLLESKINAKMQESQDMSLEDAVDAVIIDAQNTLK